MSRRWQALAVFAASLLFLLIPTTKPTIGLGYLDPIDPVEAQDEAVYSHIALRMAAQGNWATPIFMGRYFLYKPPLLYWLSAGSAKLFGPATWALRAPSLLAGALLCMLAYLWAGRAGRGLVAVSLLSGSSLFVDLAGRNMTDTLACAAITSALYLLSCDPELARRGSWIRFGLCAGVAILAKSTAGLLPLLVLAAWWLTARSRPGLLRVAGACGVAAAVSLPWFLYQYAVHGRWFWNEFVLVELLAWGAGAPPQTSAHGALAFYALRLWRTSPALCVGAALAIPLAARKLYVREPAALLPVCWIAITTAAIFAFQYRNATYLLPLLPALAVMIASHLPIGRPGAAAAALFLMWTSAGLEPRRAVPADTLAARTLLEQRCDEGRDNEIILVGAPDQFYATVLPFSKVRYAFGGDGRAPQGLTLDFRGMGVTVPVEEFVDLDRHRARYAAEMRSWGLPNDDALATVIAYPTYADLAWLVRESPTRDLLLPAADQQHLGAIPHRIAGKTGGYVLLEAESSGTTRRPPRACRM